MEAQGAAEESVQVVVSSSDSSFPQPLPFNSHHTFDSGEFNLPDGFFSDLDFDFSLDDIYTPFDPHGFNPNTFPDTIRLENDELQSFEPPPLPPDFTHSLGFDFRCPNSDRHFSNDTKCSDSLENQASDTSRVSKFQPDDASFCDKETPHPASSANSRAIDVMNSSSPASCSSRDVSESLPSSHDDVAVKSGNVVDARIKSNDSRNSTPKRKKDDQIGSPKFHTKFQRFDSSANMSKPNPKNGKIEEEEDDKRKARLIRNRESAQLSRQRQKHYVEELEEKVKTMNFTIQDLSSKISYIMAENSNLRQQLFGNGMARTAAGVYPPPPAVPLGYPWFHFPPCIVKSQGSQVPLVPIPKLKPQQTPTTSKPKRPHKKKIQIKTKKVAGVSLLGVLFFMLFFGVLVPMVKVKHVGVQDMVFSGLYHDDGRGGYQQHGRMLTLNDDSNGSNPNPELCGGKYGGKYNFSEGVCCNHLLSRLELPSEQREVASRACRRVVKSGIRENSTLPIAASLFVPRNDQLVKIDGNLIIHSVLASERSMASQKASKVIKDETGLVVAGKMPPPSFSISENESEGARSYVYRTTDEAQKALTSGSSGFTDASSATDGELHQWFHEGLAGPMMRSGMCKEVFQFDVSSSSVALVMPPSTFTNQTGAAEGAPPPPMYTSRNRRILQNLTVPPPSSPPPNVTTQKNSGSGHPLPSSIVVSVLLDPRHPSDNYNSGGGGGGSGASPRPIFVILLLDSVKYVTYSCMLPLKLSPPLLSPSF